MKNIRICQLLGFLKIKFLALFFIILVPDRKHKEKKILINHAKIHLTQQRELWFIGFFFLYIFYRLKIFMSNLHKRRTYRIDTWVPLKIKLYNSWKVSQAMNPFELEATINEKKWTYLSKREPFAFKKYMY
jgi:hypothetical protein